MKRATQHRADKNTVISVIVTTNGLLHLSHQRQSGWRSPGGSVFVTSSSYTSVCPLIHGDNLQALASRLSPIQVNNLIPPTSV